MKERFEGYFPHPDNGSSLMESSAEWEDEDEKLVHEPWLSGLYSAF